MYPFRMKVSLLSAISFGFVISLVTAPEVHAALLVYDGYGYVEGTSLNGTVPGANTVGLGSTAYGGTAANNYTVNANSLTFSNLATTGGSISFTTGTNAVVGTVQFGAGTSTPYVGADVYLGTATTYTGTLYNSYLVKLNTTPTTSTTVEGRVSDSTAALGQRFISAADSRVTTNGTRPSVSYDNSDASGGIPTLTTTPLGTIETYLMISKFTGVGSTLTDVNQAFATLYILTASQFDSFIAAGGTESYLDAATIGSSGTQITGRATDGNNNTSGTPDFGNGDFVQYLTISSSGTIDETRYGTTLADVIPLIPEPSSFALSAIGSLLVVLRRNRYRTLSVVG